MSYWPLFFLSNSRRRCFLANSAIVSAPATVRRCYRWPLLLPFQENVEKVMRADNVFSVECL